MNTFVTLLSLVLILTSAFVSVNSFQVTLASICRENFRTCGAGSFANVAGRFAKKDAVDSMKLNGRREAILGIAATAATLWPSKASATYR